MRYVKFKRIVLPLFFIFFIATGLISRRVVIAKSLEQQEQTIEPVDAENIFSLFIPVVLNQAETGSGSPNLGVPPGPIDPGEPEDPADPGDPSDPADPGDGEEPGDPGDDPGQQEPGEPEVPVYQTTGFEVDGNSALDGIGEIDWETTDFPPAILIADPHSKSARDTTTFKPSGKFDQPESWKISQGKVGPPQTELTNVMTWLIQKGDLAPEKPSESWLVMAMERTKTEGTFYLDFEYNQMAWDGSNGTLLRSPGDLSIGFAIHGNPDLVEEDLRLFIIQFYPGNQPESCEVTPGPGGKPASIGLGSDPCPTFGDQGWFYRFLGTSAELEASGIGQATMNETPFPAAWPSFDSQGNPRDEIPAFQFAEAAINLDALAIELTCSSMGSVHAKGRSSIEPGSDLKDLAGPVQLRRDCRVEGHKYLDIDGDGSWDVDEPPLEDWTIHLTARETTKTDNEGRFEFNQLEDGIYTVEESCPEGWVQTAPAATDFEGCGSESYEIEVSVGNSEITGLDFGNGRPDLALSQSCPADVFVGDDILYTVNLTNTGNVDLRQVVLENEGAGGLEPIERFTPGQSTSVTFSVLAEEPGQVTLAAEASGSYGLATVQATAQSSCATSIHALTVKKEAYPSVERQYHWLIEKQVDNPGPTVILKGRVLYPTYTVTLSLDNPAYTDGPPQVAGTITVKNPSPLVAQLDSVMDMMEPGMMIAVDCPELEVPAGGTLVCTYGPVDLPDMETRLNTAIATLKNNNGGTKEFKDSIEVDFDENAIQLIDEMVDVNDTLAGFLGTVQQSGAPKSFSYQQPIGPFEDICGDVTIDNVATYMTNDTEISDQDSASVDVYILCTVRIGFEDRPIKQKNDWDYNDLVVDVDLAVDLAGDPANPDLEAIHLTIDRVVGAPAYSAKDHEFHVAPNIFECDGSYLMRSYKEDGSYVEKTGSYTRGDDFLIFNEVVWVPDYVELSIFFDVPEEGCPCNKELLGDPLTTFHGEALFFRPWMKAIKNGNVVEIYPGNPELLAVPDVWQWPDERQHIWELYPKVTPGNPPTFVPYWWLL